MRYAVPTIREQLRTLLDSRAPLAATRVATQGGQHVVLTLAPRPTSRLRDHGSAIWETRVYIVQPPGFGIGTQPHYAALDADRDTALSRHETLLLRLERGSFPRETSREILQAICPSVAHATQALRGGDTAVALAALDESLRAAGRLDAIRVFLHLYAESFLMRALVIAKTDARAAVAAYRELIALHAEHPLHHPETLRAVATAREAVERLSPVPVEQPSGESGSETRPSRGAKPAASEC